MCLQIMLTLNFIIKNESSIYVLKPFPKATYFVTVLCSNLWMIKEKVYFLNMS